MYLYKVNDNFELRSIAGENMLVPTGTADFEPGTLLMLNETGSWIWNLLKEEKSAEEILSAAKKEFTDEDGTMEGIPNNSGDRKVGDKSWGVNSGD